MAHNYSNVASRATTAGTVNNSATSFTVDAFNGFPSAPFYVLVDRDTGSSELMEVTGVVGNTLTVIRGQGGTAATSHSLGAVVEHVIPASVPQAAEAHHEATANVHGAAGGLVGADSAGTLTAKTYRGAHRHLYSDVNPAGVSAGYEVQADTTAGRDGFVANNAGADANRRGVMVSQAGTPRIEGFYDGTLKVTPSGTATRPAIDAVGQIRATSAAVTGAATVGGTLGVTGAVSTGAVTAAGAVNAQGVGTGLAVANNATVGGTLGVTGASTLTGAVTAANGVTVSGGNVVLSGANAKLQLPSTATGTGTAAGQVRYRNGVLETWNGTRWVGTFTTVAKSTTANSGLVNTANASVFGMSIADPGFRYRLVAQGQCEMNNTSPGTRYDLAIVLDNIADTDALSTGIGLDGGSTHVQTGLGASGDLTGAHTLYLVARRAYGSGQATVTAFNQHFTWMVVPA